MSSAFKIGLPQAKHCNNNSSVEFVLVASDIGSSSRSTSSKRPWGPWLSAAGAHAAATAARAAKRRNAGVATAGGMLPARLSSSSPLSSLSSKSRGGGGGGGGREASARDVRGCGASGCGFRRRTRGSRGGGGGGGGGSAAASSSAETLGDDGAPPGGSAEPSHKGLAIGGNGTGGRSRQPDAGARARAMIATAVCAVIALTIASMSELLNFEVVPEEVPTEPTTHSFLTASTNARAPRSAS
mmetsp:Transcript_69130/g.174295  ORF Transcript_69130/g.174295 Transcript_69130/m.174295 type:complete len:242 (-) Transcript_69130:294-1019(-)